MEQDDVRLYLLCYNAPDFLPSVCGPNAAFDLPPCAVCLTTASVEVRITPATGRLAPTISSNPLLPTDERHSRSTSGTSGGNGGTIVKHRLYFDRLDTSRAPLFRRHAYPLHSCL